MQTLIEILKARAGKEIGALPPKTSTKILSKKEDPPTEKEEPIQLSYATIEEPDEDLFLLTWAPFLRNPLRYDFTVRRDYASFILEGRSYVINLFIPINAQRIFEIYQSYLRLVHYSDINKLCYFCWQLELSIPSCYQERIEFLIHEEFSR